MKAPFAEEQVANLKKWQETVWVHPFTCCSHDGCERAEREDGGTLIPTTDGWHCPCGKYKQDWAHDNMCNGEIPPDWRIEFKKKADEQRKREENNI